MAEQVDPAGYVAKIFRDWDVPQGSDTQNTFKYGRREGEVVTHPDMTGGWSAHGQIRDRVGGEVWADFDSASVEGARIDLGPDGFVSMVLPHDVTQAAAWNDRKKGVYDLELTTPDGDVIRAVKGRVVVHPDVTRQEPTP